MLQRYYHGKHTSVSDLTLETNCTLHQPSKLRTDTQTKACASKLLAKPQITLNKRLENLGV